MSEATTCLTRAGYRGAEHLLYTTFQSNERKGAQIAALLSFLGPSSGQYPHQSFQNH
ncbi:hypothetical protein OKW26_004834 [Paraburkholderia sp. 32]